MSQSHAVTLHYFEMVSNGLGVYDRSWHLSREDAEEERERLIEEEGYEETEEPDGSEGQIGSVKSEVVQLTPEGLLSFAQSYAVDSGSC